MWPRQIHLRRAAAEMVDDADRLRIVDDDEVVRVGVDLARVQLLELREHVALLRGQALRVCPAAHCGSSSSREERVGALDDPPLDREPRVLHERHERVLDLGDAAAERRRGELEHARAGKRLGELADLVHQPAGRDRRVVRKRLVTDVDELEHAAGGA